MSNQGGLTDQDIALITLFKGVNFSTKILKIPREKVIHLAVSAFNFEVFKQIRKEILKIGKKKGLLVVNKVFGIDQNIFLILKQAQGITRRKRKNPRPVKSRKEKKEVVRGPEPIELVTSDSLFKGLRKGKKQKFIEDKFTAVSKEFLVQEAEKCSTRFGICEKFDIDRATLSKWTRSYYERGFVKESKNRYKMASDMLQRAFNEITDEEKIKQ
jgi:hypothetical protein